MRATTIRSHGKLITIKQAESEYGLPGSLIRDLIHRGDLAAVQPPNIRRVFLVRADLEQKLHLWRVR